jgi:hypothetical protein
MDVKVGFHAIVASTMMILPPFYADILSAGTQMTIKSVLSLLLVEL